MQKRFQMTPIFLLSQAHVYLKIQLPAIFECHSHIKSCTTVVLTYTSICYKGFWPVHYPTTLTSKVPKFQLSDTNAIRRRSECSWEVARKLLCFVCAPTRKILVVYVSSRKVCKFCQHRLNLILMFAFEL